MLIPWYLKMDTSGIGPEAGLLQVMEGMNCGYDEVPDNCDPVPNCIHQ